MPFLFELKRLGFKLVYVCAQMTKNSVVDSLQVVVKWIERAKEVIKIELNSQDLHITDRKFNDLNLRPTIMMRL